MKFIKTLSCIAAFAVAGFITLATLMGFGVHALQVQPGGESFLWFLFSMGAAIWVGCSAEGFARFNLFERGE